MQNLAQNDFLQYNDAHMMQYFVNDSLNVNNQYEQQQPIQNVLCSNQQSSNSLKAQNSIHPSQSNLNRSRNQLSNQQHHTYPQSHQPQFHNQATTSKQFISNLSPINQQIVSLLLIKMFKFLIIINRLSSSSFKF